MHSLFRNQLQRKLGPEAELKPLQADVLDYLWQRKSVFASLPTGYGKSLCYFLPALTWQWKVVVACPMIALMEDQGMSASEWGLRSIILHSQLSEEKFTTALNKLLHGAWDICFVSPERLTLWEQNGDLSKVFSVLPDLLVFDEFHGLEDWQGYRKNMQDVFGAIRNFIGKGTLLLAMSASMSCTNGRKWMQEFCEDFEYINGGLGRKNLRLWVVPLTEEREKWLLLPALLRGLPDKKSIIIYCATREETDELHRWLSSVGFLLSAYHAGMPALSRKQVSEDFRAGRISILCATSAFGLGIDYRGVDRVIHFSMPYSIESYWQEVGRAGRGGQEAYGVCLWLRSDISRVRILAQSERMRFFDLWSAWIEGGCRRSVVACKLEHKEEKVCGKCDVCLQREIRDEPFWLQTLKLFAPKPWWLEDEAQPEQWLSEKTFS